MMSHHHHLTRRKFIGQASCAALGSTTLLSTLTNLKFINAASIANSSILGGGDYKAMVCILLSGGSDSHNMLIPKDQNRYNDYANTRGAISIPRDEVRSLNNTDFGVHPSMSGIQQLFNDNKLSFISNIGTLLQPMVKDEVWQNEQLLPLGLFSHSDQTQQWQTSLPNSRSNIGFGGKLADLMSSLNTNDKISMNVSLSGSNIFQTGESSVEYSIDPVDGSIGIEGYSATSNDSFDAARRDAIDNLVDANYTDIYRKTYIDVIKNSRDANIEFTEAIGSTPFLRDMFSNNDFSESLHMIAKTIAARDTLGMKRQIFFVDLGGWDHHDELLNSQAELLNILNAGMTEFNAALERLNIQDCVTTFTASEFGRTLTWNGNGTDHAWAGNVMVMGGPVVGGRIFGDTPSLELGSGYELGGGGVMLPTLSVDEYFAELALWFGVSPSELNTILPNIGNFYNTGSGNMPIGFLG
ncbi:MAG: DUF1501 domain-containing protein [Saprospiraceae bacterium]|nr:DUF1501 domain-containing protein [Saprospiraceae bacterium]